MVSKNLKRAENHLPMTDVKTYAQQLLDLIAKMEEIDAGTFDYLSPLQVIAMNKMKAAFGQQIELTRVKEAGETWRG